MSRKIFTRLTDQRLGAAAMAFAAVVLVLSAWLHDDAFVTLRTIDNFLDGHGLVWNPGERVQAFTHPLWLFVNTGLIAVFGHYELTCLLLAVGLSLLTLYLVLFRVAPTVPLGCLAVLVLLCSKGYTDYTTSGLEDPLTRLMLVVFVLTRRGSGGIVLPAFLAALATLNRPDVLLVFLPALAAGFWRGRSWRSFAGLALGFLPLALWGAFALFYYGSPFPNTAYAKLGMGVPRVGLVLQGFAYLFDSLIRDPVTLTVIVGSLICMWRRPRSVDVPIVLGGVFYLAYVIWIGGDYMSGRFLGLPFLAVLLGLARYDWPPLRRPASRWLLLLPLLLVPRSVEPFVQNEIGIFRIGDERRVHHPYTGLVYLFGDERWPSHFLRTVGERSRTGPPVRVEGAIGMAPFYGGPGVYVVDLYALADPLRARLPGVVLGTFNTPRGRAWRAGHTRRPIPEGYLESLEHGDNRIVDPDLARYYETLRFVTRGKLGDPARIRAAMELALGVHDPRLEAYVERHRDLFRPQQGRGR